MAFLTRSEVMRPFPARFFTKAAFDEPEENQAIFEGLEGELVRWMRTRRH